MSNTKSFSTRRKEEPSLKMNSGTYIRHRQTVSESSTFMTRRSSTTGNEEYPWILALPKDSSQRNCISNILMIFKLCILKITQNSRKGRGNISTVRLCIKKRVTISSQFTLSPFSIMEIGLSLQERLLFQEQSQKTCIKQPSSWTTALKVHHWEDKVNRLFRLARCLHESLWPMGCQTLSCIRQHIALQNVLIRKEESQVSSTEKSRS